MPRSFTIKVLTVVAVIFISLLFLAPSLSGKLPSWWAGLLPSEKIRLGLDLQGGMHLILEVEVDKAVSSSVERSSQELARRLRDEKIRISPPETDLAQNRIAFNLLVEGDRAKLEDLAGKTFPDYQLQAGRSLGEGQQAFVLKLSDKAAAQIREHAASQALETIRNRVDQFGVAEPEIVPQPPNGILVQLPGVREPQRAKDLIGRTAQLEFKLVDDTVDPRTATKATVPAGSEVAQLSGRDRGTGRGTRDPIVIRSRAAMTGETIRDARVMFDSQSNEPYVSVAFNAAGTRQFADLTTRNVKKRLAIVLDGKVQSAPVIQEPITGGEARITGDFTLEEARDLAVVLRSGALPAPVKITEERTVGPSLGRDSINQGLLAALVGGLAVFLFMAVYYKLSGLAADFAVILNVIIIMAVMAGMQATLTLPGIAGIILTIGMAVDANVLINERIREELRLGKTTAASVEAGYARATVTIFDANITTVIAALVLYQFGTGPIKGFAVTLTIGLATSMFTAIVVTRLIFDWVLHHYRPKTLSI